ncbi:hypothetical protein [uncultured Chryseobacterium sp.]|jgi:hypothetical protein|uniref:hypothetical protein n=1 Tax=uncultured Chryseobacterium sp. TaxID=259322 RepID=UPI00262F840E|nr:hypothetical protein [uncultured Chryseobacterium sp.]
MEHSNMESVGKFCFWTSFILGNICLFGYMLTEAGEFAWSGFLLLTLGGVINLIVAVVLLLYGAFNTQYINSCVKSVGIMLLNVPIAALYTFIGMHILK